MNDQQSESVNLPNRVVIGSEVIYQELGDEIVLLNLQNERYYGLDAVGARAWKLLTDSSEVDSLINTLLAEYDVEEAVLRRDLSELFSRLSESGMVTVEDAS